MLYQHFAPRGRPAPHGGLTGPIKAGRFLRINKELVRVEGWHPREYTAHHRENGKWVSVRIRGGHLATVMRIRDRQTFTLAEQYLYAAADAE